ncbi:MULTISPECIES: glycosyltransferase family 2 protein [Arthrobacter]|uniref:glycosyltransferase family 2 protein n=1 Tax=Arthrobacter TaxID=1663 RepID=UPI001D133F8F|nr:MULTISPECIES: glycosyltransferase family 2 protein [Arthrobacter]MCC3281283.1 glycosyltransferase [Arthrobacter caoxuetaonis]MCC9192542.1 glycosyltransferase [Arthrobacter sp. zg-Y916]
MPAPAPLPAVSVVIPCLNDAEALRGCLASLAEQAVGPLEIVVVDNDSTDNSAEVAAEFGARVVSERRPGIPAAAAAGYDAARGEVIARCDADCVLPPDWIQRIAEHFAADPELAALSGPGRFYGFPRWIGPLLSWLYLGSYYQAMRLALARRPLFGSNLAMRSTAWRAVREAVHRKDAEQHDDVCLSAHLCLDYRCAWDRSLVVGMAPRAVIGPANLVRRFRRAFHTLAVHWRQEAPWERWIRRFRGTAAAAAAPAKG